MSHRDLSQLAQSELLCRFTAVRDECAFAELVQRHGSMVMRVAKNMTHHEQDAEEVYQSTFFALASARLKGGVPVAAWLYETTIRTSKSILRTNMKWARKIEQHKEITTEAYIDHASEDCSETVQQELSRLRGPYRAAVLLCDLQGLSRKEAAQRLGLPLSTVCNQVTRGRKMLRARLARRGVSLSFTAWAATFSRQALGQVNPALIQETTRGAFHYVAGKSAAEIGVSQMVLNTTAEVIKAMTIAKATHAVALVAVVAGSLEGLIKLLPSAGAATIVAPMGLENVEGNSVELHTPPPPVGLRAQHLVPASDFAGLPDGRLLNAIRWRPDASVTDPISFSLDVQIRLSTTDAAPGMISRTFAENVGSNETLVYSGPVELTKEGTASAGPHSFDYAFQFQTPFAYDSSNGNLLMDFVFRGPFVGTVPSIDAQSASVVYGVVEPNPSATTGSSLRTQRPVTQFVFIPEPPAATSASIGLVFLSLVVLWRSRATIPT